MAVYDQSCDFLHVGDIELDFKSSVSMSLLPCMLICAS